MRAFSADSWASCLHRRHIIPVGAICWRRVRTTCLKWLRSSVRPEVGHQPPDHNPMTPVYRAPLRNLSFGRDVIKSLNILCCCNAIFSRLAAADRCRPHGCNGNRSTEPELLPIKVLHSWNSEWCAFFAPVTLTFTKIPLLLVIKSRTF